MKKILLVMLVATISSQAKALTVNASFFLDATAMQTLPYTFAPGSNCSTGVLQAIEIDQVWAVCADDCSTLYFWSGGAPFPFSTPNGSAVNINLTGPSTNWTALSGASTNPTCSNLIIVGVSFKDMTGKTHILQDNNYCASSLSIPGNEGAGYDCTHNLAPNPCTDMDCATTTPFLGISIYYCLNCGFGGVPGTEVWINQI